MWKRAKVIPIFKKGSKSVIGNYRPISSLSIPSKILEHQVCDILDDHLSKQSFKKTSTMGLCKRPFCGRNTLVIDRQMEDEIG